MEDVLEVYSRPYDKRRPAVCMYEKPVQLLYTPTILIISIRNSRPGMKNVMLVRRVSIGSSKPQGHE
jgi:hypothetical protein